MRVAILIIAIISIPAIYFYNKILKKDIEQYRVDFLNYLETEKFYFTGKVLNTKFIDHGAGFICLEQITTNKPIGYELKLDNSYAAIINDTNTIKFIGNLYFNKYYNEKVNELILGDSISYNFNNNGRIRAYRKKELLYDRSIFIFKVKWNKKILSYNCK